jgi:hypothetical protein
MGLIEMTLRPADKPVDQLRTSRQTDAARSRMPFEKLLVGETLDNNGFRHAKAFLLHQSGKISIQLPRPTPVLQ